MFSALRILTPVALLMGLAVSSPAQPILGPVLPLKSAEERQQLCTPIPTQGNPDLHYLSGGTIRRPFVWQNPSDPDDVRVWVAEDGGRIRYSTDRGQTWVIQDTPLDAAQMIIDIDFHEDGLTGFASGRGGKILKTTDGGDNWQHLDPMMPVHDAKNGDPGVFWGVRFLPDNPNIGWVAGLWSFMLTEDGGLNWQDVSIFRHPDDVVPLDPMDFEFYTLSVQGTLSGGFKAVVGANWETNLPPDVPAGEKLGVVFHTDSTDSRSSLGRRWWITLEEPEDDFNDPWDFDFEDGDRGYLVGGTGNGNGRIYRTLDGGLNWMGPEQIDPGANHTSFSTLYGVADLGGGTAVASGYAGNIWVRNRFTGMWEDRFAPGYTAPLMGAEGIVGTGEAWVTGSFGFLRHTVDLGTNWKSQNNSNYLIRAIDMHFMDRRHGVLVGQPDQIFLTEDGGCTFKKVYPDQGFGPKPNLSGVAFAANRVGIAVGYAGNVVRTTDGGKTWSTSGINGITDDMQLEDIVHKGAREYWAVGRKGPVNAGAPGQTALIIVTTDGGTNWTELSGLPQVNDVQLSAISFRSSRVGLVVGRKGSDPIAFYWNVNSLPAWSDVSPQPDPGGKTRGLLDVTTGFVNGDRQIYACGQNGTLLRWEQNALELQGVPGVYEFDTVSGTVNLQIQVHDYSAIGIAPGIEHILVGNNNNNHLPAGEAGEGTSTLHLAGTVLRFDGSTWEEIKASTNADARAFSFVTSGGKVTGFMLGGGGPGGIVLGTLADAGITIYTP